jgi:hypothetical protein
MIREIASETPMLMTRSLPHRSLMSAFEDAVGEFEHGVKPLFRRHCPGAENLVPADRILKLCKRFGVFVRFRHDRQGLSG